MYLSHSEITSLYPSLTREQIRYIIRKHNIDSIKEGNVTLYSEKIKEYLDEKCVIQSDYISSIEIHQLFPDVTDKQLHYYLEKNYINGFHQGKYYYYERNSTLQFLYCRYYPKELLYNIEKDFITTTDTAPSLTLKWINKDKGLQIYKEESNNKSFRQLSIRAINIIYMMDIITKLSQIFPQYKDELDKITFVYEKKGVVPEEDDKYMIKYTDVDSLYNSPILYIRYTKDVGNVIQQLLLTMKYPRIWNNSVWYPQKPNELVNLKNSVCISKEKITPKYPIYIISKGRATVQKTSTFLNKCGIKHYLVVEPSEYDEYYENVKEQEHSILLKTPEDFSLRKNGGIPVRNWVWEHSKTHQDERHWILDDNISKYERLDQGQKVEINSGAIFRIIEDYVDSFENIKMAGHNYTSFVISSRFTYPITKNTRIYSSILLSNDIYPEFAWRGTYNEDTDLSLRILKAGYSTVLFNRIVACKLRTMVMSGGNTDTIYAVDGAHALKTRELVENHSDVATETVRFSRVHHMVNYNQFKSIKAIPNETCTVDEYQSDNPYNLIYVSN